jgi:hypothetical protein
MTELVEQISNFNADHPLSLLFDRCRTLADRAGDGSLPFVEAVDMAYSAASWAGLVERYGDDVVQPPSRLPVYLRQKICIDFDDVTSGSRQKACGGPIGQNIGTGCFTALAVSPAGSGGAATRDSSGLFVIRS